MISWVLAPWVENDGSMEVFAYVRGFLNLMVRASLPGSVVHPDMSGDVPGSDGKPVRFNGFLGPQATHLFEMTKR